MNLGRWAVAMITLNCILASVMGIVAWSPDAELTEQDIVNNINQGYSVAPESSIYANATDEIVGDSEDNTAFNPFDVAVNIGGWISTTAQFAAAVVLPITYLDTLTNMTDSVILDLFLALFIWVIQIANFLVVLQFIFPGRFKN